MFNQPGKKIAKEKANKKEPIVIQNPDGFFKLILELDKNGGYKTATALLEMISTDIVSSNVESPEPSRLSRS